ncbi:MAG TPA: hypothetical protein VFE55_11065 [Acidimicrobiia bacterium]|nr:hypothetical protein [Acidimicrobiia bacterium]
MLPYRVYLPRELEAMSPLTGGPAADRHGAHHGEAAADGDAGAGRGLRALLGVLPRLVRRRRLRQPAPGTI